MKDNLEINGPDIKSLILELTKKLNLFQCEWSGCGERKLYGQTVILEEENYV
jgi:hypothetical protein